MRSDATGWVIGHLGSDAPAPRTTTTGKTVVTISVAVNRKNSKGETVPMWFRADVWNPKDTLLAQLKKGAYVRVRGDMYPDEYTARDGTKVRGIVLSSANVIVLASSREESAPIDPDQVEAAAATAESDVEDELPF